MKNIGDNKKILIGLAHPAHFHFFKEIIYLLVERGYSFRFVITEKEILRDLLDSERFQYDVLNSKIYSNNLLAKFFKLIQSTFTLFKLVSKERFHLILSCSPQPIWIGALFGIPRFYFGEDDYDLVKLVYKIVGPFCTNIFSPFPTDLGPFNSKKISYNGYQKLAYLHPNYFQLNSSLVEYPKNEQLFILRLSALNAHHDRGVSGISNEPLKELVKILSQKGCLLISSERDITAEYKNYLFRGKTSDIHHYLAKADLFIGDSQSMAVESALLGVPNIRFNDFIGKISILEELEGKYKLTKGISSQRPDLLLSEVNKILNDTSSKDRFAKRRMKMLKDKIDVTTFLVWFVENYPQSKMIIEDNPDYQNKFC